MADLGGAHHCRPVPPPPFWNLKKKNTFICVWTPKCVGLPPPPPCATFDAGGAPKKSVGAPPPPPPPLLSFFGTCATFDAGGGPKSVLCPPPFFLSWIRPCPDMISAIVTFEVTYQQLIFLLLSLKKLLLWFVSKLTNKLSDFEIS